MFRYNFALALRGLRRFPRSTVLAAMTVAFGLGAAMTTLALLHQLAADPLPGRSGHLYLAWVDTVQAKPRDHQSLNGITVNDYHHIKMPDAEALLAARKASMQAVVADFSASVESDDGRHHQKDQTVLATSSDFIPLFGVPMRYGRGWTATEDTARSPVAVIDDDLARQLYGTANAVGMNLRIKHTLFRIIGVSGHFAPNPHFYELANWTFSGTEHESVFAPYTALLDAGLAPSIADQCDDNTPKTGVPFVHDAAHCSWVNYWVQLDTPAQVAAYRHYLLDYVKEQKALSGFGKPPQAGLDSVAAWLTQKNVVPDNVRLNVWLAGSFLLLCMTNVAGLLAARFLRRSGEIGIRRALGAPRQAIFLQHVLEGALISLVGGVLALPMTFFGLWVLRLQDDGFTDLARLDPAMFGALFLLALLVGVATGCVPAWRAAAVEPGLQVKDA